MVALSVGILFSIGFLIIGFPMAIGLGLFIGLLNMVPYLQLVGFIPTIILAIVKAADTGQNFWFIMLLALIVFAVVQVIQDTILTPKIMGHVTGLNSAIILLSLSIWGSLLGILGMIIALPMTTLLINYYQKYVIKKEERGELFLSGERRENSYFFPERGKRRVNSYFLPRSVSMVFASSSPSAAFLRILSSISLPCFSSLTAFFSHDFACVWSAATPLPLR